LSAGLVEVSGKGLAFRLEDGSQGAGGIDALVSARDVRTLVEELWLAGAQAIAVNGERVVATTAVLDIGGPSPGHSPHRSAPYQITAIGPPDLYDRLRASVGFVQFVQGRVQPAGLGLSVAQLDSVDIPAFAGTVNLRNATPLESAAP